MFTKLGARLWNTNPLWIVGAVLGIESLFFFLSWLLGWGGISADIVAIAPLVMFLAYAQNTTYGLQSRSANRNSNAYHAIAALAANGVFFLNRNLLVVREVPMALLAAYVLFTIMGTLNGNTISMKIEQALGLSAEGAAGKPQLMELWPTIAALLAVLALELVKPILPPASAGIAYHLLLTGRDILLIVAAWTLYDATRAVRGIHGVKNILRALGEAFLRFPHQELWVVGSLLSAVAGAFLLSPSSHGKIGGTWVLVVLALVTILGAFSFSLLRVARSTDHYWFHAGAVVLNLGLSFTELLIMIGNKFDWSLFLPTATGTVIGSLIGANLGQDVGKKLKAAFDAHVTQAKKVLWPGKQLAVLSLGILVHLVVYQLANWQGALTLLCVSVTQAWSFTIVSRARQRNNQQYLAWASVFSNGIWYVCMHYLAQGKITLEKAAPYLVGNAGGSLVGQNIAMKVEKATGAIMDQPAKAPKGAVALA